MDLLGYGSSYLTTNLGSMFFLLILTAIGFLLILLLAPMKKIASIRSVRRKLDQKLKWNFTIRLFLEGFMEITFSSYITLIYVQKGSFGGELNFWVGVFLFSVVILLPIFVIVFYLINFERMSDQSDTDFDDKFGSVYEGLRGDSKMSLFQPFWLCARRILLVALVFFFPRHSAIQLTLFQCTNFVAFIYVSQYRPYDVAHQNKMEIFQEAANILCVILIFEFCDHNDQETKYLAGFFFMVIMLITIGVHLFFLLKGVVGGAILRLKAKVNKRKAKSLAKKHIEYDYKDSDSDNESGRKSRRQSSRSSQGKLYHEWPFLLICRIFRLFINIQTNQFSQTCIQLAIANARFQGHLE